MDRDQNERLGEIIDEALRRPAGEVDAYLREACGGDGEMEAEARSLLGALSRAGGFLDRPTVREGAPAHDGAAAVADPPPLSNGLREGPGTLVGRYKLLQQIGEGGFGAVFMAEQREPVVRKVALKIIKLGMDTKQVIARFEAERQALAMMDHPNIAKVLDAGATETGRPYFVMELVKGDPITEYCDRNNLPIEQRLALFGQVCHAVHHAHQKGVIHRDIKPSNILVSTQDGRPHAKVIDFGIAKATSARLTEKTLFTEHRQLIGTPVYMSPEQADGSLDIDTRTDVYSLGVVLYELLAGSTPFDAGRLRSAAYGEIQRIIREVDPPRPSTRLSQSTETLPTIAARRRTEPRRLGTLLRGELDWIVMRCLDKDRARRYESASGLAMDIQRHLGGEPVLAAPASASYRLRKFARRHRGLLISAACILLALLTGLGATAYGLYHANIALDRAVKAERLATERLTLAEAARAEAVAARDAAERSNRTANAVTEFFTQDLLDLKPRPDGEPEITVKQLLDAVPAKIEKHFTSEPAVEGIIRERVGQLYRRLGDPQRSIEYLTEAVPLLEKGFGPDHKQTLSAIHRLGELNMDLTRYEAAAALFDKAYQGRFRAYGVEYAMTLSSLGRRGSAKVLAGHEDEGVADLRECLRLSEQQNGKYSRIYTVTALNLADALVDARRFEEGKVLATELLAAVQRLGGNLAGMEWAVRYTIANACRGAGQFQEALVQADEVMRILESIYPPSHPVFIDARFVRGRIFAGLGRSAEAWTEFETSWTIGQQVYGTASSYCTNIANAAIELADKVGDVPAAALWRGRRK